VKGVEEPTGPSGASLAASLNHQRYAHSIAPVDQVVANGYIRRDAIVMFASRLNPNVRVIHHVLFDHDFCTPVDVNAVRSKLPVVIRILGGGNVINEVPGNGSITGPVDVAVGSGPS
jgi:hypothetical protein